MKNRVELFLGELVEIMEEEGVIERMLSVYWDYGNFAKDSFIGALECLFGGEWIHGAAMLEIIRKTDTQLWLDILQDASAMEVLNG